MSDNPIDASLIRTPIVSDTARAQRATQAAQLQQMALMQVEISEDINALAEEGAFSPAFITRRFESTETKRRRSTGKEEEPERARQPEERRLGQVEKISEIAEEFSEKSHRELHSRTLLLLRNRIAKSDSMQDIIRKVREVYPDYSLADDAIRFLLDTAVDTEVATAIRQAQEQFRTDFRREITAGKNIQEKAREFSQQGLGTPTALRDMYREITGNPRDANTLFEQFSAQYPYDTMKTLIEFLLHALGSDLKAKGPSIPRGELHRLFSETRILQAILGVYRFFRSRIPLLHGAFQRQGIPFPGKIDFETLARHYMRFLQDRYPSADKVLRMAISMGIAEELLVQEIIFMQLRDASRQVAPLLFKSEQHRQDILRAFIDALEQLEEQLEEEEEAKEDGKKKQQHNKRELS